MRLRLSTAPIRQLHRRVERAGQAFTAKTTASVLRRAAKPLLDATRREVPVGNPGQGESIRLSSATRSNEYRRGGATRNDLRIRMVAGRGVEVARALVGVSKKRGKVGWRTHFITRGTVRMKANDFLTRASNSAIGQTMQLIRQYAQTTVTRLLR